MNEKRELISKSVDDEEMDLMDDVVLYNNIQEQDGSRWKHNSSYQRLESEQSTTSLPCADSKLDILDHSLCQLSPPPRKRVKIDQEKLILSLNNRDQRNEKSNVYVKKQVNDTHSKTDLSKVIIKLDDEEKPITTVPPCLSRKKQILQKIKENVAPLERITRRSYTFLVQDR
ncbi:unnamed protein product [Didymodactylos carnosus]|uniref:Uncharacterized protein n=1 Tax=Didymodactylos carnosus TaxID=1234261 RepID=A0A815DGW1_9BILA|nr:unnamed protein product [Didymodactylos carnosus]CAF1503748.1 unnamed protein product [Didymodactylos carnosus]CAF4115134.1 unnamed protein product [Didymodactylos carnosus]CAF4292151.1 unnamed protein product [Didymodactylos carnosus]